MVIKGTLFQQTNSNLIVVTVRFFCHLHNGVVIFLHSINNQESGNYLFNDALNTFYLRLYGVGHNGKEPDSERGNSLPTTWATLSDYKQGFFYMHNPADRIAYTTVSRGALAGTIISSIHRTMSGHSLPRSYISLL